MNNPSPRLENHIIGPKKLFEEQRYLGEYRCSCGKTFFDNVQGAIAHLNDFAAKQQEGKPMNNEPSKGEKIDMLIKSIDVLIVARARQRIAEFVENSEGAAYHAETAIKAQQLLKEQLELML